MELIKVTNARHVKEYKIEFEFSDGKKKTIDLYDELQGEIFEPLKDPDRFKNFRLNDFTIEWDNGADFAPEFLYHYGEKKQDPTYTYNNDQKRK
jgi:hypothetical protein